MEELSPKEIEVGPPSFVYTDGAIVFRTVEGRRVNALHKNPRVSIAVGRTDQRSGSWKSVIVADTAEFVDEKEGVAMITELLGNTGCPGTGIVGQLRGLHREDAIGPVHTAWCQTAIPPGKP